MTEALSRPRALAAWVVFVAALVASACGGDDEQAGPTGEQCFLAGQIDANCLCAANRPRGLRTCMQNLIWSECACGEPFDEPCMEGDPVECPPCEGETRGHTTTCLRAGTFDCGCESTSGRGGGARADASFDDGN